MYYSEWTCTYDNGTILIGFIVHEYLLTYDSNVGDCRGFFRVIRSGKINKKVRPKTRILKIHGGEYFGSLYTNSNYKNFIQFISLNKKIYSR